MILEIDNVELSYGSKKILHGIYLKGESGKVTGLLGRNGCGKTSLLRILFGDLSAKYQTIRLDEAYQKKKLYRKGNTSYLPQHKLLPVELKINKVFSLFKLDWNDFIAKFDSFKKYENAKVSELSSGERRVIETYLILLSGKDIILLDEPFSFIAPIYVEKFKTLIQKKKKDSIIIITDHFYRDILDTSDTIYLIKNGSSKLIKSQEELVIEGYITTNPPQR